MLQVESPSTHRRNPPVGWARTIQRYELHSLRMAQHADDARATVYARKRCPDRASDGRLNQITWKSDAIGLRSRNQSPTMPELSRQKTSMFLSPSKSPIGKTVRAGSLP